MHFSRPSSSRFYNCLRPSHENTVSHKEYVRISKDKIEENKALFRLHQESSIGIKDCNVSQISVSALGGVQQLILSPCSLSISLFSSMCFTSEYVDESAFS